VNEHRAATILQILTKQKMDPFETLVVTIISQNTADRNTDRAFDSLSKRFEINPEALSKAKISEIEDAIRVAGLYQSKANAIKQAAITICTKNRGSLKQILSMPLEEARKTLMSFPGVGPKTADVVLLFSSGQSTVPVDTHVNRVSKRLGFAPEKGDYEAVRCSLQALYPPNEYLAVHLLLIAHGRKTCKAQHPLCRQCPLYELCPSNYLGDKP
jgi:endonuclease-3